MVNFLIEFYCSYIFYSICAMSVYLYCVDDVIGYIKWIKKKKEILNLRYILKIYNVRDFLVFF